MDLYVLNTLYTFVDPTILKAIGTAGAKGNKDQNMLYAIEHINCIAMAIRNTETNQHARINCNISY